GLLGISLAGVLFANKQSAEKAARASREQAREYQHRLAALLLDLQRTGGGLGHIRQVVLKPTAGSHGVGGAIRETPSRPDQPAELAVLVAGLDAAGAPYRVWLVGPGGRRLM